MQIQFTCLAEQINVVACPSDNSSTEKLLQFIRLGLCNQHPVGGVAGFDLFEGEVLVHGRLLVGGTG